MEKPISRQVHAFIDYAYAHVVLAAPEVFDFDNHQKASLVARSLSGSVFLTSLLTRYEGGLFRVLPFKTHLTLDYAASIFAVCSPWLFGFSKRNRVRNTFIAIGLAGLLVASLTEDEEMAVSKRI